MSTSTQQETHIPQAIAAPPPIAQWSLLLSMAAAAIAWGGQRLWDAWSRKEAEELGMNRVLVEDLRRNNEQIISDLRDSHKRIEEQIALKEAIVKTSENIQKVIGTQALMLGEFAGRLSIIEGKIENLFPNQSLQASGKNDSQQSSPTSDRSKGHDSSRKQRRKNRDAIG